MQRLQQEAQVGGDEVKRWGGNEDGAGGTSPTRQANGKVHTIDTLG